MTSWCAMCMWGWLWAGARSWPLASSVHPAFDWLWFSLSSHNKDTWATDTHLVSQLRASPSAPCFSCSGGCGGVQLRGPAGRWIESDGGRHNREHTAGRWRMVGGRAGRTQGSVPRQLCPSKWPKASSSTFSLFSDLFTTSATGSQVEPSLFSLGAKCNLSQWPLEVLKQKIQQAPKLKTFKTTDRQLWPEAGFILNLSVVMFLLMVFL